MQMLLQARFVRLERRTMRVAPAPATVDPARSAADSSDGAAPVLEERLLALRGQQISDFPLCNKSFNLSYCGHDL